VRFLLCKLACFSVWFTYLHYYYYYYYYDWLDRRLRAATGGVGETAFLFRYYNSMLIHESFGDLDFRP